MEIWQLFFLGPFAAAFLLWLIAPVLLLAIPALMIIAIKKHHRKEDINYFGVIKALVITVLIQILIFATLSYGLPLVWQPSPSYITNAVSFFSSQVIGFVVMIYLLGLYQATASPEEE